MHLVEDIYIVDEYNAFVIPDSGMSLSQIRNIIEVVKKFKVSYFIIKDVCPRFSAFITFLYRYESLSNITSLFKSHVK